MKKITSSSMVGGSFGFSLFILFMLLAVLACSSAENSPDGDSDVDVKDRDGDGIIFFPDGDEEIENEEEAEAQESVEEEWGVIDPELDPTDLVLPPFEIQNVELPNGLTVRVASYNVYGFNFADADTIGAMLASLNPDLVSLQEMRADQLEALAASAGMDYSYTEADKAILSKTPLENPSTIELYNGRSLLHANTTIGGVTFSFYAAHISWNTDGDRQCRQIAYEVLAADPVVHLIIAGDFNDEVYSTQINMLAGQLGDVYTSAGLYPGERITWPSTRFDDSEGSQMIDLIFFRKDFAPIVLQASVINLAPVLSDHKPVMAEMLFSYDVTTPFAEDPYAALRDVWRDFPPQAERPANLLKNPGAEKGLDGWLVYDGAETATEREAHTPHSGNGMFTGFTAYSQGAPHHSSGCQNVDLSAMASDIDAAKVRLYASAYMTTGYQTVSDGEIIANKPMPYDEGEVVVEALDADGVSVQQLYSKRRDTLGWNPFAGTLDLAPGVRAARYCWISHHKPNNGASNDALFDDLYMGVSVLPQAHKRIGGNLLINPGAELAAAGEDADGNSIYTAPGWELNGWNVVPDRQVLALVAPYPSLTFSGAYYFLGGDINLVEQGHIGLSTLAQKIDLSAWREEMKAGNFALRWGGHLRSWAADNGVTIALEIYNNDGSLWARIPGAEIKDAEWTSAEFLTRIPAGTSAVRLVIESDVAERGRGALADALFVLPEKLE